MRGGSTAVTTKPLHQIDVSHIIYSPVDKDLKRIVKPVMESQAEAPSAIIADIVLIEHRGMLHGWLVGQIDAERKRQSGGAPRRNGRRRQPDPRQGWLPLPEYPHIPLEAQADSLEEYRQRIIDTEAKAKSYAKRSIKKEVLYKRQLSEMRRLERKVAPFFANDPTMTIGSAVVLLRESISVAGRAHQKAAAKAREAAKRAGKVRT